MGRIGKEQNRPNHDSSDNAHGIPTSTHLQPRPLIFNSPSSQCGAASLLLPVVLLPVQRPCTICHDIHRNAATRPLLSSCTKSHHKQSILLILNICGGTQYVIRHYKAIHHLALSMCTARASTFSDLSTLQIRSGLQCKIRYQDPIYSPKRCGDTHSTQYSSNGAKPSIRTMTRCHPRPCHLGTNSPGHLRPETGNTPCSRCTMTATRPPPRLYTALTDYPLET